MATIKKKQKSPMFTVAIMIVVAAVIIGGYFMLNRGSDKTNSESDAKQTECQKILSRDMTTDYPGTVRELAKYYCRIQKCLINEDITHEELESLVGRLRELFDADLLAANLYELHVDSIEKERKQYAANDSKINSYTVAGNEKLKERTVGGRSVAELSLYFTVKTGTEFNRSFEDFMFRKDENGKWKILGWQLTATGAGSADDSED